MNWSMYWSVLGVALASCLVLAPVLYVLMRRELRKAFRPLVEDLDSLVVQVGMIQTNVRRLRQKSEDRDDGLR